MPINFRELASLGIGCAPVLSRPIGSAVEAHDELEARVSRPRPGGVQCRCAIGMSDQCAARPDSPPRLFVSSVDFKMRLVCVRSTCGVLWPAETIARLLDVRREFVGTRMDQRTLYTMGAILDQITHDAAVYYGLRYDPFDRRWVPS
jgi:hypothetical protein